MATRHNATVLSPSTQTLLLLALALPPSLVALDALGQSAEHSADSAPPEEPTNDDGPVRGPAPPLHPAVLAPATKLAPGEHRPLPSYDGRPRHTTLAEDLLWIPRVLFAPIYVVDEYGLRKPIGAIASRLDPNGESDASFAPTALIDLGFRPSAGLFFSYDHFILEHDALRATFSVGGANYLRAKVVYRIPLGLGTTAPTHYDPVAHPITKSYLQLETEGMDRPDGQYWGTGWGSHTENDGHFEMRNAGGGLRIHGDFFDESQVESWVTMRRVGFAAVDCDPRRDRDAPGLTYECGNHPIAGRVAAGAYALPPGFDGYSTIEAGGDLLLDSRRARPEVGHGIALDLRGKLVDMFAGKTTGEWVNLGASLAGFVDVSRSRRVLGLTVEAHDLETFGDQVVVPFTELVGALQNGYAIDDDRLRGFRPGRLLGKSSLSASLEYSWPIWTFIDASLQAAVGNVFDEHWRDFSFERLRFSFTGGFAFPARHTFPAEHDHSFNFLLGFGTAPFVQGGAPDSLRLLIGGTTGI